MPPDGQVTIAAGEQADSSGAADLTTTDIAPPGSPPPVHPSEANRNRERDDEEEQPYWASFEEDKSVPSEEELKIIEQQPVELDALNRKYHRSIPNSTFTRALILRQTITGRSWHLNRLTTPNMYLQQQAASRGQ